MNNDIKAQLHEAYEIALSTLRERYQPHGIFAGKNHFSDIWVRDSLFASLGSLAVEDYDIVRTNLKTHLDYMKEDGQLPLRIGQKSIILKFLGFKSKKIKARYIEDKGVSVPTDGNSLFLILLDEYLKCTDDYNFVDIHFEQIKAVMDWNFSDKQDPDHDLLIEEGPYAGWMDSLKKNGKVLYTNVLHYKATLNFAELCAKLEKIILATQYLQKADRIKSQINSVFWNDQFYTDWIDRKSHNYFSSDGNLLAILFGVADKEKAQKIYHWMDQAHLVRDFCIKTNYPNYHDEHIYPLFFPLKMADYHNGLRWLWIGCLDSVVRFHRGQYDEAIDELLKLSRKILEFKGVYEVYSEGEPLKRFSYSSEQEFAWSSGMFVWACHQNGYEHSAHQDKVIL